MWQFPMRDGEVVKGEGEFLPDKADSVKAATEINSFLDRGGEYDSWLITDLGVDIRFSTSGSDFRLTGDFYHYFWKVDRGEAYRKYEEQFDALFARAEERELQGKTEEAVKLYKRR